MVKKNFISIPNIIEFKKHLKLKINVYVARLTGKAFI